MTISNSKRFTEFSLLLTCSVMWLFSACKPHGVSEQESDASALPELAVVTAVLKSEEVPVFEEVVGTVRPGLEAQVSAKITGRIIYMNAVPGMKVGKGGLVAKIEVEELKAGLEKAEATLENAERDLSRYKKLLSNGAATQAEFDAVQARHRIAVATAKETRVMIANASVEAPFDGIITRKFMDTGDLAAPGRPLFSIEDSSLLRLEIHLPESLASQVSLGEVFRVRVDGAVADLNGTIAEISPSADPGSRTFLVKLDLEKMPALRAGQFGRAFIPRARRMVLKVPREAIIRRGQMDYVFIAQEGLARLRIVRTEEDNMAYAARSDPAKNKWLEILAGVENGERVVLSPPPQLRDGQRIRWQSAQSDSGNSELKNK